jgi:protein-S-isoprenylcysteine O-methyltransferase Ste14
VVERIDEKTSTDGGAQVMRTSDWWVVVLLGVFLVECFLVTFVRRGIVPGEKKMQWSLYALLTTYSVIWICSLVEFLWVRHQVIAWVSIVAALAHWTALALRLSAIRRLGKFWSLQVEIRQQHRLIREGAYRFVRHPAYSAIIVEVLMIPIVANAWWSLALAATTLVPLLLMRIRREEEAMVAKFGDTYREYQQEVGALIPRWSSWHSAGGAGHPSS